LDWLKFLNSDDISEMEAIAEKNKEVGEAVIRYKELTVDETERWIAAAEEDKRRMEFGIREYALEEGRMEGEVKGRVEGEAKGRMEGEAKGRTEGEAKGRTERDAEIAKRLAELGKSKEEITAILGEQR
jgi:hypothetical protein